MKRISGMMAVAPVLALLPVAIPSGAKAQGGEVVQALPPAAAVERLNSNLAKLSRTPQDVDALLGAGQAALDLGDVQAANGFFTRANMVNPRLGQAKLGLAVVELALKQAQEAAANFDAADALGEHAEGRLADRGLAYDLTGQQAKAQRDYQAALRANPADSKARMRYAVSLGISGRLTEAEQQIEPLLKSGDREAWRFRAFIYAMNGKQAEARNITTSVMPKGLADALEPYMVRTPLLTPAQKAAAAHYGDFPANVLRLNPPTTQVTVAAASPPPREAAAAEPAKRDNGRRSSRNRRDAEESKAVQVVVATPAPQPAPTRSDLIPPPPPADRPLSETVQTIRTMPDSTPARVARQDPPRSFATVTPAPSTSTARPAPVLTPTPTPAPTLATPPARIAASTPTPTPTPAPAFVQPRPAASSPAPSQERTLASALSQLTVPADEKKQDVAAVDLGAVAKMQADKAKKAADAKAKAEKEAKAKAEAAEKKRLKDNPSRVWVQIAAGKNKSALAFDMRRFRKSYADAIGDQSGWSFEWGATNRLLIGPYKSEARAKEAVSAIKKAGGDAFIWESEAGDEVQKIGS